jgi:hypothetical protein
MCYGFGGLVGLEGLIEGHQGHGLLRESPPVEKDVLDRFDRHLLPNSI